MSMNSGVVSGNAVMVGMVPCQDCLAKHPGEDGDFYRAGLMSDGTITHLCGTRPATDDSRKLGAELLDKMETVRSSQSSGSLVGEITIVGIGCSSCNGRANLTDSGSIYCLSCSSFLPATEERKQQFQQLVTHYGWLEKKAEEQRAATIAKAPTQSIAVVASYTQAACPQCSARSTRLPSGQVACVFCGVTPAAA